MSPTIVESFKIFSFSGKTCTEYNVQGGVIQRNRFANCSLCPVFYFSHETFECKLLKRFLTDKKSDNFFYYVSPFGCMHRLGIKDNVINVFIW